MPTICFLIPYFGKWPAWMPYFIESCRANGSVNWLLYTDCGPVTDCPKNVTIVQISFEDYCKKVSLALNIVFKPSNAYKLCDIKPALGFIHTQEITQYDFWAFGDIDVIYGNLRQYFTNTRLESKDLYTTHDRRVAGHLCLIRNNSNMNQAFMRVKNWKVLFTTYNHVAFDEKAFSKIFLRHKNSKLVRFVSMLFDPWLRRAEFVEMFCTPNARIKWIDGGVNYPKVWTWKEGVLTNDVDIDREFLYLHFMVWKKLWIENLVVIDEKKITSATKKFTISANGFTQQAPQ